MKQAIKDWAKEGIDEPLNAPDMNTGILKKGKVAIMIIYEDLSYLTFYKKFKTDYTFVVKKKRYLIIPECILKGKNSMLVYYYNNPYPIGFKYEGSKAKASKIPNVYIDATVLNNAFNSNLLSKMYGGGMMTPKNIIIILVAVTIITLIFLQVFGVVDVMGMITGKPNG